MNRYSTVAVLGAQRERTPPWWTGLKGPVHHGLDTDGDGVYHEFAL
ncbi:MAG: hypothetical protein ACYSWY_06560 [Planctomycetota bacterium]